MGKGACRLRCSGDPALAGWTVREGGRVARMPELLREKLEPGFEREAGREEAVRRGGLEKVSRLRPRRLRSRLRMSPAIHHGPEGIPAIENPARLPKEVVAYLAARIRIEPRRRGALRAQSVTLIGCSAEKLP